MSARSSSSFFNSLLLLMLLSTTNLTTLAADGKTCSSHIFSGNKTFKFCRDLPQLGAHLHWNYFPAKKVVTLAFRAQPAARAGWVAWAINPTGVGMIGAQALIAFQHANGSMMAATYPITNFKPGKLPGKLSFPVTYLASEFRAGEITIFATVVAPVKKDGTVSHVWQVGSSVSGVSPNMHEFGGDNLASFGTLNLMSA